MPGHTATEARLGSLELPCHPAGLSRLVELLCSYQAQGENPVLLAGDDAALVGLFLGMAVPLSLLFLLTWDLLPIGAESSAARRVLCPEGQRVHVW